MSYQINEVFYSLQGEGCLAGVAMVFVRFSKCNMRCTVEPGEKSPGGFDCDTEFESGRRVTLEELAEWIGEEAGTAEPEWLLLTGGEPALQLDLEFCEFFRLKGWKLAIETNGSVELPRRPPDALAGTEDELGNRLAWHPLDWICVSPKVADHAVRQPTAHELKVVRGYGQALPKTPVEAKHRLLSPAFAGLDLDPRALAWCIELVKQNPGWRLSVQLHKEWRIR